MDFGFGGFLGYGRRVACCVGEEELKMYVTRGQRSLVTNDFEELGDADIVRLMALQPPAIDTTMLDEGSESTMGLDYPFPARSC